MFNAFINPSPNNKFLDWSNLKELAHKTINMIVKLKFVLGRVENIMGKGENAGYHGWLKGFFPRIVKSLDEVVKS